MSNKKISKSEFLSRLRYVRGEMEINYGTHASMIDRCEKYYRECFIKGDREAAKHWVEEKVFFEHRAKCEKDAMDDLDYMIEKTKNM